MNAGKISGIILAGGLATRMDGTNKAFLEIGGQRIIDRLIQTYRPLFNEIIISARERESFQGLGVGVALDSFEARSSLTGIHAGLRAATGQYAFVAACDAPFVNRGLVRALLGEVSTDADVVIPLKEDGYFEPLCAVYSKACLPHIEEQLGREDYKIINFFPNVRVKAVPVSKLRLTDPQFLSFKNVNTPEELEETRKLIGG